MFKVKCAFFLTIILISRNGFAGFDTQQLTFSVGMVNASYTENASNLEGAASSSMSSASGAASVLPVDILWEFYQNSKNSFFARVTAPLLTAGKDSYFSISGGINKYFNSLSSPGDFRDQADSIRIVPKIRYYYGFQAGAGYLVYSTKTAKKSDILADLSAHVGLIYSINSQWGIRGETGYARAIGVATTTSVIRAFVGFTRDVNEFF
ncbi:MAG: hypothetical protein HOP07_04400 [Bacteriovoracaceae bacterium]|nr:hypothetical protein [Bacteriovoracaceae bacterium]